MVLVVTRNKFLEAVNLILPLFLEDGCEKEQTILLLHDEIGQLKEQLTEERQKNLQLLKSIEKQKERLRKFVLS